MLNIFSKETVNSGRQIELDIAKWLAVFFMVLIHTQEYFSSIITKWTNLGNIIEILGWVPAAPVFMFLLGLGIVYSSKSMPTVLIKRWLIIFCIWYLLNLLRWFLPNLMNYFVLWNINYFYYWINQLFYVDILQFAWLTMIFFGLVKKYNFSCIKLIIIWLVFSLINIFIMNFQVTWYIYSWVTGLFWWSNSLSFFPFLTWILYPIIGYIFWKYLIRCSNKNLFYLYSLILSLLVIIIIYLTLNHQLKFSLWTFTDMWYYQHNIVWNIVFSAIVILWLSILYFITMKIPICLKNIFWRWSKNVTEIYFIHWILIWWLVPVIWANTLSLSYYFVIFTIIFLVSDWLADYYLIIKKAKQQISSTKNNENYTNHPEKKKRKIYITLCLLLIISWLFYYSLTKFSKGNHFIKSIISKNSIYSIKNVNWIIVWSNVLIYDESDLLLYPAFVTKIENDLYSVNYYFNKKSNDYIESKYVYPETIWVWSSIQVYDDNEKLIDAVVISRDKNLFNVTFDWDVDQIYIGDIVVKSLK